jgi:transmembrane sensor
MNVHLPRSDAAVRRQAYEWSVRMRGDNAAQHRETFEDWRAADPRNASTYERLEGQWTTAGLLAQTDIGRSRALPARRQILSAPRLGLAFAVTALVMAIGLGFLMHNPARFDLGRDPAPAQLASDVGEIRTLKLVDGSVVTLDTDSAVRLAFRPKERRIFLTRGRARFQVAHDPDRPFVVFAGTGTVVARGTIFDVSLLGGRISVTLLRGRVDVHEYAPRIADHRRTTVQLYPGQRIAFRPSDPIARPQPAVAGENAWVSGMLSFDAERLGDALAEANRYNATKISVADPALNNLRITGAYHVENPASFARAVAASLDLDTAADPGGGIVISPIKPPKN